MSWISEKPLNFLQTFCIRLIRQGKVPRHIAFIMDGNRRFASKYRMESAKIGHMAGFEKLTNVLSWCYRLGVAEVTVYAFSLENFKRTPQEVDDLMNLAYDKFEKLLSEKEKLHELQLCIRIVGDLKRLEPRLQKILADLMTLTKDYRKLNLNIALAYTARHEITTAIENTVDQYEKSMTGIDTKRLNANMFLTSPVDILFRTSNEARLSDFLLWQISNAEICFDKTLWPEYSIWDLLKAIFRYQKHSG